MIVEVCPFRQYKVKLHGSGRSTTRNRAHLKPLLVFKPVIPIKPPDAPGITAPSLPSTVSSTGSISDTASVPLSDSSSSYAPSSSDYVQQSSERSRSPLVQRTSSRKTQAPDRYGEWTT